ncbi:MAG TPA: hypothetical protein VF228_17380 [Iamia sp.]
MSTKHTDQTDRDRQIEGHWAKGREEFRARKAGATLEGMRDLVERTTARKGR